MEVCVSAILAAAFDLASWTGRALQFLLGQAIIEISDSLLSREVAISNFRQLRSSLRASVDGHLFAEQYANDVSVFRM